MPLSPGLRATEQPLRPGNAPISSKPSGSRSIAWRCQRRSWQNGIETKPASPAGGSARCTPGGVLTWSKLTKTAACGSCCKRRRRRWRVADILLKDAHLIEVALVADQRVISLDEEARLHFGLAASAVPVLCKICWVNPARSAEQAVQWLARQRTPRKTSNARSRPAGGLTLARKKSNSTGPPPPPSGSAASSSPPATSCARTRDSTATWTGCRCSPGVGSQRVGSL